jgi:hypothetical protein
MIGVHFNVVAVTMEWVSEGFLSCASTPAHTVARTTTAATSPSRPKESLIETSVFFGKAYTHFGDVSTAPPAAAASQHAGQNVEIEKRRAERPWRILSVMAILQQLRIVNVSVLRTSPAFL